MKLILIFALAVLACGHGADVTFDPTHLDRCTTMIVGKKAGKHGPMTTHTADCLDCDFRANKVPAADHPKGSMRNCYLYKGDYPQSLMEDRGPTWTVANLEGTDEQKKAWGAQSEIVMQIPEVEHTYAIFEAGYGIMNEHQLAMGESTCAARFWAAPPAGGGQARMEVREMSKIALERCKTARCAIELMGGLAEQYGYYTADWSGGDNSKGEGGEALTVIDPEEAWVFHVLSDDTRTSAVWAAQRVPDDHIAAVANSFVIRHIDPEKRGSDFLYSDNIHEVAERNHLWKPKDGLLDFLPTYAPMRAHAIYSTRRIWRIFSLAAPSKKLPAHTDMYADDYPFSVPVDHALDYNDLIRYNSDHYEGSEFDLTKGVSGGPYGDPARFDVAAVDGMTMPEALAGSYERSISMFRTSYSFVAVARELKTNLLSMLWFSQYQPSTSSYAPVYIAGELPVAFTRGSFFQYDPEIPFWNYLAANNYASRFYKYAIQDVFALRDKLHEQAVKAVDAFEKHVNDLVETVQAKERRLKEDHEHEHEHDKEKRSEEEEEEKGEKGEKEEEKEAGAVAKILHEAGGVAKSLLDGVVRAAVLTSMNQMCSAHVAAVNQAWRDLLPQLISKYHDGVVMSVEHSNIHMDPKFYPKWWLKASGYFLQKLEKGKDVLMFASGPTEDEEALSTEDTRNDEASDAIGTFTLLTMMCGAVLAGYTLGKKSSPQEPQQVNTPSDMDSESSGEWFKNAPSIQLNPIGRHGYAPIQA